MRQASYASTLLPHPMKLTITYRQTHLSHIEAMHLVPDSARAPHYRSKMSCPLGLGSIHPHVRSSAYPAPRQDRKETGHSACYMPRPHAACQLPEVLGPGAFTEHSEPHPRHLRTLRCCGLRQQVWGTRVRVCVELKSPSRVDCAKTVAVTSTLELAPAGQLIRMPRSMRPRNTNMWKDTTN